ncbi:hypothetical protein ABPG75_008560 [Micractinium tetrahymenae]
MRRRSARAGRVLAALALLLAVSACCAQDPSTADPYPEVRIVGGTAAPSGRYPYFASLRDASGNHFCGAALVAPSVLVTAAHCLQGSRSLPQVHIGRGYLTTPEVGYDVRQAARVVVHPSYDPSTSQNDVAVILLDSPSTKAPIALPSSGLTSGLADGVSVTAIGFGTTSEGALYLSESMQHVTVSYIAPLRCNGIYSAGQLKAGMLCAGVLDGGKDTCQGDSGGPLILPGASATGDVLVGATSWGFGCARAGLPGVYTDVAFFRSWIDSYLALWGAAGTAAQSPPPPPPPLRSGSTPVVTLSGPGQIVAAVGLNAGTSAPSGGGASSSTRSEDDLCSCSTSGESGGVQTGRRGCAMHGFPADTTRHCYVVGGTACTDPDVQPSPSFPGAAWKPCRSNDD